MVEVHNGSISVDSILNKGSIFKVKLPNVLIEGSPRIIYEFNKSNTELELSANICECISTIPLSPFCLYLSLII